MALLLKRLADIQRRPHQVVRLLSSNNISNSNSDGNNSNSIHHDTNELQKSKYWSTDQETGRAQRPIFVAATKQHVGKTTTCLALMSGLQKRFNKVGFLKPVGQQHVNVKDKEGRTLRVDKDVVLIREHFKLDHVDYADLSPVIIPQGYTKKFVDGEISVEGQLHDVQTAIGNVAKASDVVLIEGTGHCAVGSIIGLNNAKVASMIGADMVLV
jgi:dethiobiotin synthetase